MCKIDTTFTYEDEVALNASKKYPLQLSISNKPAVFSYVRIYVIFAFSYFFTVRGALLNKKIFFTLGTRIDHYSRFALQINPRASVVFKANKKFIVFEDDSVSKNLIFNLQQTLELKEYVLPQTLKNYNSLLYVDSNQ